MDGGREAPQVQRSRGRPGHTEPLCGRRRHFKSCRAGAATELSKSSSLLPVPVRGPFWNWPFLHIEQHIRFLFNKNKLRIHIRQTLIFYCIVYKLL
jgi:hypothetical protein